MKVVKTRTKYDGLPEPLFHRETTIPAGTQVWAIEHNNHYFRFAYLNEATAQWMCDKLADITPTGFSVNFLADPQYITASGYSIV